MNELELTRTQTINSFTEVSTGSVMTKDLRPWKIGTVLFENFKVIKILGEGGRGSVYLVEQIGFGNERFALKKNRSTRQISPALYKRIIREIRIWIELPPHPNLVTCRFFRMIDDQFVIFSDFIDGGSLLRAIMDGRIKSLPDIIDIAVQTAWGLQIARAQGVIHQDVKSSNILLTSDGVAKLTDFGSACFSADRESVGFTWAYCSPEQARELPVDSGTDVWSWGVTVLEMLCGGVKWTWGPMAPLYLDKLIENSFDELPFAIPDQLISILKKCFETRPENRWQDFTEPVQILIDLYGAITHGPFPRKNESTIRFHQRDVYSHDRRTVSDLSWDNPRIWINRAKMFLNKNSPAPDTDSSVTSPNDFILQDLELFNEAELMFRNVASIKPIDATLAISKIYANKALLLQASGDFQGAITSCDKGIKCLHNAMKKNDPKYFHEQLSQLFNYQGIIFTLSKQFVDAIASFDQASDIRAKYCHDHSDPETCRLKAFDFFNKGIAYNFLGQSKKSLEMYQVALDHLRANSSNKESPKDLELLAKIQMNYGNTLFSQYEYQKAISFFERSIKNFDALIRRHALVYLKASLARAYLNKASSLHHLGEYVSALLYCDLAIEILEKRVLNDMRKDHAKLLLIVYANKTNTYSQIADFNNALITSEKSIELAETLVLKSGFIDLFEELARNYLIRANLFIQVSKPKDAIVFYDKAIAIRRMLIREHKMREIRKGLSIALVNKAVALMNCDMFMDGLEACDQHDELVLHLIENESNDQLLPNLAVSYQVRADIFQNLGKESESLKYYDEAINTIKQSIANPNVIIAPAELSYVKLHRLKALINFGHRIDFDQEIQGDYDALISQSHLIRRTDVGVLAKWIKTHFSYR